MLLNFTKWETTLYTFSGVIQLFYRCHHFVKLLYIIPANSDGSYQRPYTQNLSPSSESSNYAGGSIESAQKKISVAGALIQSILAESMDVHGFDRKTIQFYDEFNDSCCEDLPGTEKTRLKINQLLTTINCIFQKPKSFSQSWVWMQFTTWTSCNCGKVLPKKFCRLCQMWRAKGQRRLSINTNTWPFTQLQGKNPRNSIQKERLV